MQSKQDLWVVIGTIRNSRIPRILDKNQQFMPKKKEYDKGSYEMLCSFWEMNG